MNTAIIEVERITKSFGDIDALGGIDLQVAEGTVYGLLGPNGAGKTTLVRILTTLLKPDGGSAHVAGFDVVRDAKTLRASIGLAGQFPAVDEILTGRENLEMVGRLYRLGWAGGKPPCRGDPRAIRAHRSCRSHRQDVLRRNATPPRSGRQPRRETHRSLPR